MRFLNMHLCLYIYAIASLFSGCADSNFLDKTKIEDSILMGTVVKTTDPIAQRVVMIAQNFEINNGKPQYFGLCTGIILNPTTILTAAHCAKNFKSSKIITSTNVHSDPLSKSQIYSIEKAILHDEYIQGEKAEKPSYEFDIALLKIDRPMINIAYDSSFLISLPTKDFIQISKSKSLRPLIAGYGRNMDLKQPTNPSRKKIPINGILEKANVEINDDQYKEGSLTINQNKKAGVCSGDSGGPLFVLRSDRLYLQGLAVAVIDPDNPLATKRNSPTCNDQGVFLNLDFYKEWIAEKMSELNP